MSRGYSRDYVKDRVRAEIPCTEYLTPSKGGLYCCPYCGSGSNGGANSDGALKYYPNTNTWHCFACDKSGDNIDLERQQSGLDYNGALSLLADRIGLSIADYALTWTGEPAPAAAPNGAERAQNASEAQATDNTPTAAPSAQSAQEQPTAADYTEYYKACRERLADPAAQAYLQQRGISPETAAAYWLGFDPQSDPANAPGATGSEYRPHPAPRLIIPTSPAHYIGRRTDGGETHKKLNAKGSTPAIFNSRSLYTAGAQAVFVVEGAIDALSVIEAGAAAIALNSTSNADMLLDMLQRRRTDATLILCLDNDKSGKAATEALRQGLQRLNISFISADISGGYKDPNEALTGNRAAFIAAVEQARQQAKGKPDNTSYYIDALMTGDIEKFKRDKKTGFANLDSKAGGLYAGLYVLAAISSLGKTSFALQLADQLAEGGQDVIFFSLEQSKLELVSKSLARRTAQNDMESAVTSLAIRKGYLPRQVLNAATEYKKAVSDRLSIIEGNFTCNITFIGDYIRSYIARNKTRPVVFIDYLQILQPEKDERGRAQSTKETVDTTVTTLKRISQELGLTVIVISSVNRANYLTPIDFESLKESGGIEFTADVIWGLQLQCLNDPLFDRDNKTKEKREKVKEAKAETPRKIELSCLKNRYGVSSYSCFFEYYPANDLFKESSGAANDFDNLQEI